MGTFEYQPELRSEKVQEMRELDAEQYFLYTIDFISNNQLLNVGAPGIYETWVWNIANGEITTRLLHKYQETKAISRDGKYILTIGVDSWSSSLATVKVWELQNEKELHTLKHDINSSIVQATFSLNGKYIATAGDDLTVRVWDRVTGQELSRLQHKTVPNSVSFTSNGKYLITFSTDGVTRVWLWQRESIIEEACPRLTRNLSKEEWQQYFDNQKYRQTCPNLPIHPSWTIEGIELAKAGDIDLAIASFREAQKYIPSIDLYPETEKVDRNPKELAERLAAATEK
jgi:WD40 repeat protein